MADNLRYRIAAVWLQHDGPYSQYKPDTDLMRLACDCGWVGETDEYIEYANHFADEMIGALPELPVKVTTDDELDALPFLTVIREVQPLQKGIDYGAIYERRTSGWQCIAGVWVEPECNGRPSLPVMVLWRGKDETNA